MLLSNVARSAVSRIVQGMGNAPGLMETAETILRNSGFIKLELSQH